MKVISSFLQFNEIKNNALRNLKLKQTNFVTPDKNMEAAINAGRVKYIFIDDCLCVIIRIHNRDCLYFWLNEPNAAFIPDETQYISFSYYGNERLADFWGGVVNNLKMNREEKVLRHSIITKNIIIKDIQLPANLTMKLNNGKEYSYDDYLAIIKPYFDPFATGAPDRWEWEIFSSSVVIVEIRDKDGTLAAFQIRDIQSNRIITRKTAVSKNYRRLGLGSYLVNDAVRRTAIYQTWVSETNVPSLAMFKNLGILPDGTFRVFYSL